VSLKICPQCGAEYELDQRFCPKDGTTLRQQDAGADLVGAIIADRYHVLRKLGEGGMGQVYLAEHVKMGRKSALKVMNPAMVKDADAISRFNREAANASKINHPHVADVYDFGETSDGVIYLAMEFVDGPPLRKIIEEHGALPPLRAATIARQAADALAVAHDMGIVHRDLKPDNIMIARNRDGSDCVKVVDFGIAKAANNVAQKVTKTGLVVGTPEYMSPEQLAGDKLDGRSDIYALGLVTFNMLTGRLPFPAETVQESMIMRLTEQPRTLGEMRPEVRWSNEVQATLDRALQRDAAARYQSASEFGRDLARAVERMLSPGGVAESPQRVSKTQAMEREAGSGTRDAGSGTREERSVGAPATRPSMPATRVGGDGARVPPAADGGAAAGVSRKRNTAAVAGAGAVILIAALAGAAVLRNAREGNQQHVTPAGDTTSHTRSGRDTTPLNKQLTETAGGTGTTKTGAGAPHAINVNAQLDSLDKLADVATGNPMTARQALDGLDALEGRLATDDQVVHAALVRANAQIHLNRSDAACEALRKVRGLNSPRYGARVRFVLENSC